MTAHVQRTAMRTVTHDDLYLSHFGRSLSDELLAIKWIGNAGSTDSDAAVSC